VSLAFWSKVQPVEPEFDGTSLQHRQLTFTPLVLSNDFKRLMQPDSVQAPAYHLFRSLVWRKDRAAHTPGRTAAGRPVSAKVGPGRGPFEVSATNRASKTEKRSPAKTVIAASHTRLWLVSARGYRGRRLSRG
jgi:hypothetical protein